MTTTMPHVAVSRLPVIAKTALKADLPDLRKAQTDIAALVGACVWRAALSLGWSLKELAGHLDRGERQVAAWIAGREHPQLDVLFGVEALRAPLVIALAGMARDVEVVTEIRVRRVA